MQCAPTAVGWIGKTSGREGNTGTFEQGESDRSHDQKCDRKSPISLGAQCLRPEYLR
ncbi:MAG: hypothetical protein F6K14_10940 [Symploca sp. SIO2C1]|nr:hypothetical protein [Symploca sp. SIO2C1]